MGKGNYDNGRSGTMERICRRAAGEAEKHIILLFVQHRCQTINLQFLYSDPAAHGENGGFQRDPEKPHNRAHNS